MSLFPRYSTVFGPSRQELGPFFNLFNDTFSELQRISDTTSKTFAPKFDVKEVQDKYILEGELPGIAQKDVSIEFVDEQTLQIKGRTESYKEEGTPVGHGTQQGADGSEGANASQPTSDSKEVATTGSKEVAKHEPKHTYWVSERSVGEFARSFAFPNGVDHENVKASLKDGVLSVIIPKLQKAKAGRKIAIE